MAVNNFTDGPSAPQRAIHLVDIENLLGGADFEAIDARRLEQTYGRVATIGDDDLVVVSSSHFAAPATWFGWQRGRRLVRSGQDGADRALLDVIEAETLADQFERVVVGSGDGIFAESCARLQQRDCAVTVVSRSERSLSRKLGLAAKDLRFLADETLESHRNRRFVTGSAYARIDARDLEVPVMTPDHQQEVRVVLDALQSYERLAGEVEAAAADLRDALLELPCPGASLTREERQ